ncbi:hypothetical protein EOL73_02845 [Candidatus Saccharibacteria bacterium]|jgi:hypothetical protein|nr:hypothetical protein [Candidatus Saccharibacteria bacterium]NCU40668.1 hypothetical protein [Candidatus Saccharibacteria bacterium]
MKIDFLPERIELCKLIIARDSMDGVAEASGLALAMKIDHTHPLYKPLHDTIVSSYGRAFTEMRPLGKLSPKWFRFGDTELEKAHEMLMYYRHKNVSHTEVIESRVLLYPKGAKISKNITATNVQYGVLYQTFAPSELIAVQKLAGNIAGRLIAEIERLMHIIYGENGIYLSEITDVITDTELAQLEASRKKTNKKQSR